MCPETVSPIENISDSLRLYLTCRSQAALKRIKELKELKELKRVIRVWCPELRHLDFDQTGARRLQDVEYAGLHGVSCVVQ